MSEDVRIERRGRIGLITLNRPTSINAIDHAMVLEITAALREWKFDDAVEAVVVTGAGERGLCAGGDIVSIYHDAKDGTGGSADFWRDEYRLNAMISEFPKPYVAIMDGIVMGGGVGIAAHGDVRIVTERSKIGMPEVGIGFVPDVGGTLLLANAPGELGTYLALTTARMTGADAIAVGFADHFVPSADLPALVDALTDGAIDEVIAKFAQQPPASELAAQRDWIDECYSADTVEEIVARLQSRTAATDILGKSPVALKVTLESLRRARTAQSLTDVLATEYRVSVASLHSHDLVEGIRAQVIDKDRNPMWSPARLEDVTDELVASYFAGTEA